MVPYSPCLLLTGCCYLVTLYTQSWSVSPGPPKIQHDSPQQITRHPPRPPIGLLLHHPRPVPVPRVSTSLECLVRDPDRSPQVDEVPLPSPPGTSGCDCGREPGTDSPGNSHGLRSQLPLELGQVRRALVRDLVSH